MDLQSLTQDERDEVDERRAILEAEGVDSDLALDLAWAEHVQKGLL